MFLRYVRPERVEGSPARLGFFHAAYELQRRTGLGPDSAAELATLLAWFESNLAIPEKFNRTRSKGDYRRLAVGVSWFRGDAREMVGKAEVLVALLGRHGFRIEVIRTGRVGYVTWEDAHQVVAEPFADTPV